MITEIFIIILVVLKSFNVIDLSWTTTVVISLSLIVVEIQMHLNKKSLLNGILGGAKVVDDKLDDFEYRLNSKQDRDFDTDN